VNTRTLTVTLGGVAHTVALRVPDKNPLALTKVGDPVQATSSTCVATSPMHSRRSSTRRRC